MVIDSFRYCIENKGMVVYGFVTMSNHIHVIMQSKEGRLSDLIGDFKKFTSKNILDAIKQNPESGLEWMLERFAKGTEMHQEIKMNSFGSMGIMQKKYILCLSFGTNSIIFI